jgi:transcriptional regulator with XRE-family HTH domain
MTSVDGLERRRAFCARLKAERERHGTTLSAIADATKVKASLLEALERADVSHWPKGIYRRAFFKDYVSSFGLPPDRYAAEFHELFPDADDDLVKRPVWSAPPPAPVAAPSSPAPTSAPPAATSAPSGLASSLRLTLAHEEFSRWTAPLRSWPGTVTGHPARLWLAAAVDLALVAGVAFAVVAVSAVAVELAAAVIGAVYYSLGTGLLGRTPACWWVLRAAPVAPYAEAGAPSSTATRLRNGVAPRTDLRTLVGQTLRARSAVRDYVVRLSDTGSLMAGPQRRRDLAQLRRRRIETANSPADQGV